MFAAITEIERVKEGFLNGCDSNKLLKSKTKQYYTATKLHYKSNKSHDIV